MITVGINLTNRKVLIVGAGCVARRKASLFNDAGAIVTIIAREIEKELPECTCIIKEIDLTDCLDYFLVYACTNDEELNHQIVEYCNVHQILVGSSNEDEMASYHSMSYVTHELGTLAFLSQSTFPYMSPVLNEMTEILDQKASRLQHMMHIRMLLKGKAHLKDYFDQLYTVDEKIVVFIDEALTLKKGYIYVHHNESKSQEIQVNLNPALVLSISELQKYQELFDKIPCTYIPLVISEGNILDKINTITNKTLHPLIENDEDLNQVLQFFDDEHQILCIYLHPRKHVTYATFSNEHREFHLLTENVKFNMNKQYRVISFLMNHGNHYQTIQNHIREYNDYGFMVEDKGVLSDYKEIIAILEKKNTK